eukprot:TRINITY_DN867_c0_g1_i16.p1 TRINITY_DN867_c0_g1~~TRINITY_DN867_c0_g1_i16.p1  ORF type:complete len:216 (-),score=16.04 TRINITY_DN867_c0_g1_i16:470-1117(-)
MVLEQMPLSLAKIYGSVIPSLMYCDDTVMCFRSPSVVVKVLDEFSAMSGLKINRSKCAVIDNSGSNLQFEIPLCEKVQYLGFSFDKDGLINQSCKFLKSLPDKYHEIKHLRLSPIGMSQFTNSYILAKTTFWAQCESSNNKSFPPHVSIQIRFPPRQWRLQHVAPIHPCKGSYNFPLYKLSVTLRNPTRHHPQQVFPLCELDRIPVSPPNPNGHG